MTPASPDPGRAAREALALMMAGRRDEALPLYEAALRDPLSPDLRIGLHLMMLDKSGRTDEALALRELTLRCGGSIILNGVAIEADVDATIAEYETLIDRGLINSPMVEAFLVLLTRRGRTERIAQLCDPSRLLRTVRLDADLSAAVQALLLRLEADAAYREEAQSVRRQRQISGFDQLAEPEIPPLFSALQAHATRYLADWGASDHPLARFVPGDIRLNSWALISRGEGHNVPHTHHRGWATGVFYPGGIGAAEGGRLCVGPPPSASLPDDAGWARAAIRPEPGLLVLMPSFYTHWVEPLDRPGLRTAIAFDLVRDDYSV